MTTAAAAVATGLAAGFLAGVIHFMSLWWNTRLFAIGAAGRAFALQLARVALAVAALATLSLIGPLGILCGALGFLLARPLLLRRFGDVR